MYSIVVFLTLRSVYGHEPLYLGPTQIVAAKVPVGRETGASPEANEDLIYVLCEDGHQVMVLDPAVVRADRAGELPESSVVIGSIPLTAAPNGICGSPDGSLLYVTTVNENANGFLNVLRIGPSGSLENETLLARGDYGYMEILHTDIGHWPVSPVLSADGDTLYFLRRFAGELCAADPETGELRRSRSVGREPIAMKRTPDGKTLVIAHHLPTRHERYAIFPGTVSLVDVPGFLTTDASHDENTGLTTIRTTNGTSCLYDLAIAPDGRFAYIPHVLGHPTQNTGQIEMGWIINNGIAVIDLQKREFVNTLLLDEGGIGMADPRGIVLSEDGRTLAVTFCGRHEVGISDVPSALEAMRISYPNPIPSALVGAGSPVSGNMIRTPVNGRSPRCIGRSENLFVVSSFFSDSVDFLSENGTILKTVALGPAPGSDELPFTSERKGEAAFSDATLCYQGWLSCETCHPEGRTDGSQWDLLNDGMSNPKSTRSMVLAHRTPPSMALGVRENAEVAVRAGFIHIMFQEADEDTCTHVDDYLKSLRPVPSPYRNSDGS
ncbi:MAG: hypothetical protein Q4C47_09645, partial [Planctomycetia bacterium]|nr:hypothetical protein [Planctomycetia bacterium]